MRSASPCRPAVKRAFSYARIKFGGASGLAARRFMGRMVMTDEEPQRAAMGRQFLGVENPEPRLREDAPSRV